jgi:hypothetical protein
MTAQPRREPTQGTAKLDVDRVLVELHRRFPEVPLWHGDSTGRWFAMLRRDGDDLLIEAATPAELGQLLDEAGMRAVPRPAPDPEWPCRVPRSVGMMSAVWSPAVPPSRSPGPRPSRGRHEARRRTWTRRLWGALIVVDER